MKKVTIILLVFMLALIGCSKKDTIKNDQSNSDSNVTTVNEVKKNSSIENTKDISTNEVSSQTDNLAIEKISIEYRINSKRKYEKEYPLHVEDNSERTIFYGKKLFANIKFSNDISEHNLENKLKAANQDVYIYAWLLNTNLLSVGIYLPDNDTNPRDIDFVIPKGISSISGITLDEDRIIKLNSIPDVTVKVVSHNEAFPLANDEPFNLYYTQIERNMAYAFSLIFNSDVDKESVIKTVKSVFSKYNTEYMWLSDRELKISFKNVKDNIDGQIDLSTALDGNGNKIHETLYIAIDTTKASTFDLYDVFPNTEGVSWNYMNFEKYYMNETIVSIKYEKDKKVILVDGNIENHPSDKGIENNYTKKYTISDDSIELSSDDLIIPLLRTPIESGTTWTHPWYYNMHVETTIMDVTDDKIITRTKILDPSYHIKSIKTIYKMDTGIQEIYYYYSEDEDSPDQGIVLKNMS